MYRFRIKAALFFLTSAVFSGLFSVPAAAQTAQKVEDLLSEPAVTWAGAAVFALEAAEKEVFANPGDAFRYASERKWLPKKAEPNGTARLNGIALLLIRSFDLKGGIFYSIAKNPHYAYRELVYKEVIQGRADPDMTVSGEEFLFMIGRILSLKETETEKTEAARLRTESAQRRAEEEKLAREINEQLKAHQVADTTAKVTAEGVTISLSNIQFLANSAILTEPERAKLREVAQILENVPERNILIAGHTALAGNQEEQLRTSQERARAVADYLVSLGARTAAEITVRGYGADRPVADNITGEGMALNRRVEITILHSDRGAR